MRPKAQGPGPNRRTKKAGARVAVVAGATRGAGRGIARMLGEIGATVSCTGRSSRSRPHPAARINAGRPETIEETAEMVTAAGGLGIAVPVDHAVESEVAALITRVEREQSRLDVLALALTGQPASWKQFLSEDPTIGREFVEGWIRPHVLTAWHATKLMVKGRAGLIVDLVEQDNVGYHGAFYFDMMETLLKRLTFALANELGPKGITLRERMEVSIRRGRCRTSTGSSTSTASALTTRCSRQHSSAPKRHISHR